MCAAAFATEGPATLNQVPVGSVRVTGQPGTAGCMMFGLVSNPNSVRALRTSWPISMRSLVSRATNLTGIGGSDLSLLGLRSRGDAALGEFWDSGSSSTSTSTSSSSSSTSSSTPSSTHCSPSSSGSGGSLGSSGDTSVAFGNGLAEASSCAVGGGCCGGGGILGGGYGGGGKGSKPALLEDVGILGGGKLGGGESLCKFTLGVLAFATIGCLG